MFFFFFLFWSYTFRPKCFINQMHNISIFLHDKEIQNCCWCVCWDNRPKHVLAFCRQVFCQPQPTHFPLYTPTHAKQLVNTLIWAFGHNHMHKMCWIHAQTEKLCIQRGANRGRLSLWSLWVSSIIQHSAHRHRLKDHIKHARGPHLEITRTLPVFKMQCWEVKIDSGWFSLQFFTPF